jgi:hypothetical protein
LPQHTDGSTVDTRSEEVTSVTHSNQSAPDVSLRLGVAAVAGRWHGDRRGSCYRTPRRGGRAVIAVVPEIRMVITVGTTPTQDMELPADDVIYRINTLITR